MTNIVTTPIFYVNGAPHLGHAYSGYLAGVYKRFHALVYDESCLLISGTDEHGQKILESVVRSKTDINQFIKDKVQAFKTLWPELGVQTDIFVRTTEEQHHDLIQSVWNKLVEKGDIYLGYYQGLYCLGCEQYYTNYELQDNCCPIHKTPVEIKSEETYLFRLDTYRKQLIAFYQHSPDFITPSHYSQAILDYLKQGPLEDLSVSRVNVSWGIKVPDHQEHTIYVWIDALFSYLTALKKAGYDPSVLTKTTHIIGKDILKFHAIYWPALLLAANLPLPKKLLVHGWWTINGQKISKSNPETLISPNDLSDKLTSDGLRYALFRQKKIARDGNIIINELIEVINADLVNNFANLVKRNHTIILKCFLGSIDSKFIDQSTLSNLSKLTIKHCEQAVKEIFYFYKTFNFYQATLSWKEALDHCNGYFHQRTPWKINKGKSNISVQETCLVISNLVRLLAIVAYPLIPSLTSQVLQELGEDITTLQWQSACDLRSITIKEAHSHFKRLAKEQ
ncbi:methionine--tRNA ligase [Zooshikella harenae]|uniref:Methionine--tRNA ligase n=1 Tax=Zooshikella harenae TaxID=2827238 RepID=A0ABS5Z7M7_9GAMM|nr:methionine--tRNA ligase [Zooshikella harenae]MBU2710047.1 methionine--tRNA ligase [Zooshikella harenae]